MKESACQGELVARKRRGLSSPSELADAARHLDECEACQLAEQVGGDFDAVGDVMPGDELRIARFARAAAAAAEQRAMRPTAASLTQLRRPTSRRHYVVLPLAAALVLIATMAAGAWLIKRAHSPAVASPTAPPSVNVAAPRSAPARAMPASAAEAVSSAESAPPTLEVASSADAPHGQPQAPTSTSADQLFASANEARRAGKADQAIAGYQMLERSFPSSPQAQLAMVSLGRLLLDRGAAGPALHQFSRYLAGSERSLRLEALSGRARALRSLDNSAGEEAALKQLISEYPASVYSDGARKRLAELP